MDREEKVSNKTHKKKVRMGGSAVDTTRKGRPAAVSAGPQDSSFEINNIYCGDSLDVMRQMPNDFIDIIITSPPYNFGLDEYDGHKDTRYWDEYFSHLNEVWIESKRVLKTGGRICINIQPLFSDYMPSHHIISNQLLYLGFLFKAEILWEKHNYNCKYTAWGSWKSPSMPYMKYTWEFIEVFSKGSQKKKGDPEKADITGDEFKKWVYAKWEISPERDMKKYGHPAMFPIEIPYRLLRLFSYEGDLVLDPFNGCGTTTLAAKQTNRRYIGIDISEKYCQTARQRLASTLF